MVTYQLLVKTNSYAGNFEREMCAYMVGHSGECGVGSEFIEDEVAKRFEDKISGENDEHGCYRPVKLSDDNNKNFIIFLEKKLSKEDLLFLKGRAEQFEKERPYEYLDKSFKFKGLEMQKISTTTKTIITKV